ncbi:Heat shock protein-like protein SSE1 [Rhodotorula toruloides]|uniref:FGENESH: predicted gene_16.44 protein n=1 Tax=Rhodotorula toruloides TaxID=5286 RepID=A0A0K3CR26_RHOTO|nr:Heat shock protein-like protein SSE1 [Rhodotorula toruloides]PRQ70168.1 Heat shock protein 70 family [Rhodotorula toruloides]
MTSVIGFDIGQYGSKIGAARNRGIDILVNETSNRATPSLVAFGPRSRMIGEAAKTQETSNFRNTVGSLKRLIGRTIDDPDVEVEKQFMNAEIVKVGNTVGVNVNYLGEQATFSATQLYAMFLAKLRDTAATELKSAVNDITIAVPVWYTEAQRRAVLDAAEIAGLNCLRLINDTTATALGYGITKTDLPTTEEPSRNVAFVDIGHSDYSVSIVSFNKGQLVVRSTAFDRHFGGRDFDLALVRHFAKEFETKYKIDVLSNKKATFRLSAAVEKLKKILSANPVAPLSVESIMNDIDASSTMEREQFEELIKPLLEKATKPLEEALAASGLTKEDIETVELVGGSTRVPSLKQAIQDYFGRPLSFTSNQDEAIARGATLACAQVSPVFKVREFTTTDAQLFPIKFVWEASADAPADEGTEIVAFDVGNAIPSTKILSFARTEPFELEARYANPELLPGGINPFIGKYTVKGVKPAVEGGKNTVKVKARLNLSGCLSFEGATLIEQGPEEDEATPAPMETDGAAAAPAEGAEAAPAEPPKKVRKTTKTALPTVAAGLRLDTSIVNEFREKEGQMHASDKLVIETEDRKNALEEFVYEVRDRLESSWKKYSSEEDKEKLRQLASQAEDWLYSEEGEDATKSAYVERLDGLKVIADPIALRYREQDDRPRAAAQLRELLNEYQAKVDSGDLSHLPEDKLQKVVETVANTQAWVSNKLASQAEKMPYEKLSITSAEMLARREAIFNELQPMVTIPKPKAKTEEAPKAEETPEVDMKDAKDVPVEGDKPKEDDMKVDELD